MSTEKLSLVTLETVESYWSALLNVLLLLYASLAPVLQLEGNVKIMKEMPSPKPEHSEDDLLPEYQFDYQKAKPNRFADQSGKQTLTVVALDEDVAQVFLTPESVNKALRAFIEAMPR